MAVAALSTIDRHVEARAGIGELAHRLRTADCTIAYLGASVTLQKDGYRPRLHELLLAQTGRGHRPVVAGTGAMGSISGVFLMDDLVLRYGPDLCFVEYATSDVVGTTPFTHLGAVLEGIAGKLRKAGCEACLLYLYRANQEPGAANPVVAAYEQVAGHYGVPSINVAGWLDELIRSGEVTEQAVLRDAVHTTPLGSVLTARAIARGLELVAAAEPRARPRMGPLFAESFARTRVVPATPDVLRERDRYRKALFRFAYPYIEIDATNELRFTPDGDLVGLVVVVGPESGFIEVDGAGRSDQYLLWDDHCYYDRLGTVIFTPFHPAGTPVAIRLTDREVDYSTCRRPIADVPAIEKRLKVIGLMVRP